MIKKSPYYYAAEALFGDKVEIMDMVVEAECGSVRIGLDPGHETAALTIGMGEMQITFSPVGDRNTVAVLVDVMQAWVDADAIHEYPPEPPTMPITDDQVRKARYYPQMGMSEKSRVFVEKGLNDD